MEYSAPMEEKEQSVVVKETPPAVDYNSLPDNDNNQDKQSSTCDRECFSNTESDHVKGTEDVGSTQGSGEEMLPADYVKITDLDKDRDVLIDNMMYKGKPRIYLEVIERNLSHYKFVPRGQKQKAIDLVLHEMQVLGVRFLTFTPSPTYFSHVRIQKDTRKIKSRIQRSIRDAIRKADQAMILRRPTENISMGPSKSGGFGSNASVSGGSTTSTIATSASTPVFGPPVKIVMPPGGTLDHFEYSNSGGDKHAPGLVSAITTTTTGTSNDGNDDNNNYNHNHHYSQPSIHHVSVSSPQPDESPLPNIDAHIMPAYDNKQCEIDISPPKLVGGIESWGNTSDTFLEDHHNSIDHEMFVPVQALGGKRSFDDTFETGTGTEVVMLPQKCHQPCLAFEEVDLETDQGDSPSETKPNEESPTWTNLSRHLAFLEHRLESSQQENVQLRQMLAGGTETAQNPSLSFHSEQPLLLNDCEYHHVQPTDYSVNNVSI
jgi:hypothetical protein